MLLKNSTKSRPQGRNADYPSNWITYGWPTIHELAGSVYRAGGGSPISSLPFPHKNLLGFPNIRLSRVPHPGFFSRGVDFSFVQTQTTHPAKKSRYGPHLPPIVFTERTRKPICGFPLGSFVLGCLLSDSGLPVINTV